MNKLHVFALVALLVCVACVPTQACIQNWFVRSLTEMTITNGGVTETVPARTRYLGGYGAGGTFAQEYLCPGGDAEDDDDWQQLGKMTSNAIYSKLGDRPSNDTAKAARSFVCGTGAGYDVSQIKVKLTSSGVVTTHDARTQSFCWGACNTWYEWYTADNEWCKFSNSDPNPLGA